MVEFKVSSVIKEDEEKEEDNYPVIPEQVCLFDFFKKRL